MQQRQSSVQQTAATVSDSMADAWLRASRQQLLEDLAIKDRDLRTCSKKVSSPWGPWWVRALLWFATVFLVAIAIWGIVSLVYVNRLGKGIAGARAELASLNDELARRVQILAEDDALAAASTSSAGYYSGPAGTTTVAMSPPAEAGRSVILSSAPSDDPAIGKQPQRHSQSIQSQYLPQQQSFTDSPIAERGTRVF